MGLSDAAERAIAQLIERRGIHANLSLCLPVPIRQVARDEGWDIYFHEGMSNLYGVGVVNGPVRLMYINADVSTSWQRHAIAHEMGHFINDDPGTIHLCHQWPWLANKTERRASIVAGRILIPDAALTEFATIDEIAAACNVPSDLVELRIETSGILGSRMQFMPHWRVA